MQQPPNNGPNDCPDEPPPPWLLRTIQNLLSNDNEMQSIRSSSCGSDFVGFPSLTSEERATTGHRMQMASLNRPTLCAADARDDEMEFYKSASVKSERGSVSNMHAFDQSASLQQQPEGSPQMQLECTPAIHELHTEALQDRGAEINSMSTTQTQKDKRLLRNSKLQLNLGTHNNKCSTESSEFPVSSPSNPGANEFKQRPALLKHALPGDAFERQLALITAHKPQMTLDEKMRAWQCDAELSDVEDVNDFDELFQTFEDGRRKVLRSKRENDSTPAAATITSTEDVYEEDDNSIKYDFTQFRHLMMQNLNTRKNPPQQPDKPTTSAAAHLAAQRMRLRAAAAAVAADEKIKTRRTAKDTKKARNSTTPPATSSSDNDVACYPKAPKKKAIQLQKILDDDPILCGSSSEEASQKIGVQRRKTRQSSTAEAAAALAKVEKPLKVANAAVQPPPQKNSGVDTHEDSVFRLNRLNREIDKRPPNGAQGLIKMRLDFLNDQKNINMKDKSRELFKTPTVPPKYTSSPNKINSHNNHKKASAVRLPLAQCQDSGTETHIHAPLTKSSRVTSPLGAAFHQQHEFCNYLGLTGMSTAFAVANAIADLAKSSSARRSLRVRRQQQEVKKQNDKKNKSKAQSLKINQIQTQKSLRKDISKPGSHAKVQHLLAAAKPENSSSLRKLAKPQPLLQYNKEPEIKILCHISTECKTKVQEVPNKSDIQGTVHIPAKPLSYPQNQMNINISNGTSSWPLSSVSSDVDDAENKCNNSTPKQPLQGIRISGGEVKNVTPKSAEPLEHQPLSTKSGHTSSLSQNTDELLTLNHDIAEETHSPPIPIEQMRQKFQKYLEVSRTVKPSIYIVQVMDNKPLDDEPKLERKITAMQETPITITENNKKIQKNLHTVKRLTNRLRNSKRNMITRSELNMSQQRQLRSRASLSIDKEKSKKIYVKNLSQTNQTKAKNTIKKAKSEHTITKINSPKPIITRTESSRNKDDNSKLRNNNNKSTNQVKQNDNLFVSDPIAMPRKLANTALNQFKRYSIATDTLHNLSVRVPKMSILEKSHQLPKMPLSLRCETCDKSEINTLKKPNIRGSSAEPTSAEKQKSNVQHTDTMVSSTTNTDGEMVSLAMTKEALITENVVQNISTIETKEKSTQTANLHFLVPPVPTTALHSPIKTEHGPVLYMYYEMDVLIVVQQATVSFWKCSKLLSALASAPQLRKFVQPPQTDYVAGGTSSSADTALGEWVHLGDCKRLTNDIEITAYYSDRICIHNSIPVYMEMRCREVPRERRDCDLLSVYINVYYYQDEEFQARMHSIQLDAVQSLPCNVVYTAITESRYFIMSWPQQNPLNKIRSGLCKYSIAPQLDTLASIREFKSMRHEIRQLQCSEDDKLLGFGTTQFTIWDHRSGDVLMCYDLNMPLGRNLGSIYYPSLDIGQNNVILLFQYVSGDHLKSSELIAIACNISHTAPSHRILNRQMLPTPAFDHINNAINTSEHLVVTSQKGEEIWISCANPNLITCVPVQHTERFYARGRTQVIELNQKSLTVNSFANHVLKLAMGMH